MIDECSKLVQKRLELNTSEWRPSKLQRFWDQTENWKDSWRLEEIYCLLDSREKPPANDCVKNLKWGNSSNLLINRSCKQIPR